jgi:hypothetical protein
VVDVEHRRLHVFTDARDGDYTTERRFQESEWVSLPWPADTVPVADLLPPLQR